MNQEQLEPKFQLELNNINAQIIDYNLIFTANEIEYTEIKEIKDKPETKTTE